jgi:excisionase family DNA binding protein
LWVIHNAGGSAAGDDGGDATMVRMATTPRFLTLADVAEQLNTSSAQVYALVRRGELPAIKIGGRGQWRVETSALEDYIQQMYRDTREFVEAHPFVESEDDVDA